MQALQHGLYEPEKKILSALFTLKKATAKQLARLLYTEALRPKISTYLKSLVDRRFVVALNAYTRAKSYPLVYGIGPKGFQYWQERGFPVSGRWRKSSGTLPAGYHLEHHLGVNEFLISAMLLPRFVSQLHLLDVSHGTVFDRNPIPLPGYDLKPDGMIDCVFHEPHKRYLGFLELNNTEMKEWEWKRKVTAYINATPFIRDRFGTADYFVIVLVQTAVHFYPGRRREPEHPQEVRATHDRLRRFEQLYLWAEEEQKKVEEQYNTELSLFYFCKTPLHLLSPLALFTTEQFMMPLSQKLYELIILPTEGKGK